MPLPCSERTLATPSRRARPRGTPHRLGHDRANIALRKLEVRAAHGCRAGAGVRPRYAVALSVRQLDHPLRRAARQLGAPPHLDRARGGCWSRCPRRRPARRRQRELTGQGTSTVIRNVTAGRNHDQREDEHFRRFMMPSGKYERQRGPCYPDGRLPRPRARSAASATARGMSVTEGRTTGVFPRAFWTGNRCRAVRAGGVLRTFIALRTT